MQWWSKVIIQFVVRRLNVTITSSGVWNLVEAAISASYFTRLLVSVHSGGSTLVWFYYI